MVISSWSAFLTVTIENERDTAVYGERLSHVIMHPLILLFSSSDLTGPWKVLPSWLLPLCGVQRVLGWSPLHCGCGKQYLLCQRLPYVSTQTHCMLRKIPLVKSLMELQTLWQIKRSLLFAQMSLNCFFHVLHLWSILKFVKLCVMSPVWHTVAKWGWKSNCVRGCISWGLLLYFFQDYQH